MRILSSRGRGLLLLPLLALVGCTQTPPLTPSLRVVDAAVRRDGTTGPVAGGGVTGWEICRQPNGWVIREVMETPVRVTPRAERVLRTAAEERPRASAAPLPLPQEAPEEWQRLRKLLAENERAMAAMEAQAEALAEVVQDLRNRLEATAERRARPTGGEPTSNPPTVTK